MKQAVDIDHGLKVAVADGRFEFFEVGLQPQCNSRQHWAWAEKQGAHLSLLSQVQEEGLLNHLERILKPFHDHPVWISLDIDAICSMEAPGCSQSWTTGLKTEELFQAFSWLKENLQWQSFSIYEVSPPLDSDLRTAKLAAQFAHHFLSLNTERRPVQ